MTGMVPAVASEACLGIQELYAHNNEGKIAEEWGEDLT